MNEINPTIKKLINKYYPCANCRERNDCEFGTGTKLSYDCWEGCFASETAEGMQIAFDYLANIPWNEAMNEILKVSCIDKEIELKTQ